jgi:hypothetical protein
MDWLNDIGGWKAIAGAGLTIIAILLSLYAKHKDIFPFKPRTKKVLDEEEKFERGLDGTLERGNYSDYLNRCDDVLDERERLLREKDSDKDKT